jgi:hypothetical protein
MNKLHFYLKFPLLQPARINVDVLVNFLVPPYANPPQPAWLHRTLQEFTSQGISRVKFTSEAFEMDRYMKV